MNKSISKSNLRIICPECSNYFVGTSQKDGLVVGQCPICKAIVSSKQCSTKVKQIKVIKDFAR